MRASGSWKADRALGGSTADVVVVGGRDRGRPGAPTFSVGADCRPESSSSRPVDSGARGPVAGPPVSSAARGARPPPSTWPNGPGPSICRRHERDGYRFRVCAPGVLPPRLHRRSRWRRPGPGWPCNRGSACRCAGSTPTRPIGPQSDFMAPGVTRGGDLLRRGRVHPSAPERHGLHGGPVHFRGRGLRGRLL